MLGVLNHPRLIHDWFTTTLLRWTSDGLVVYDSWLLNHTGVHDWTYSRELAGEVILDFYYTCYLIAFVGILFWFRHFRKIGWIKVKPHVPYDAMLLAMVGVLVGAKTAYIFIYNTDFYFGDPPYGPVDLGDQLRRIFLNWSGMSSHGAVTGIVVMVFLYWLWSKRKAPAMHIGDIGCISGAFGAIWIRTANFMNGELYGRAAPDWLPWSMRFPVRTGKGNQVVQHQGELYERMIAPEDPAQYDQWLKALHEANPGGVIERGNVYFKNPDAYRQGYEIMIGSGPDATFVPPQEVPFAQSFNFLEAVTTPRHPSQVYQLLLEGVLLLIFLLWFRRRVKRTGMVAGAFFTGYPLMRFIGEFFRQPDVQFQEAGNELGTVFFGLSMGQLLSLAMAFVGFCFLVYFSRRGDVIAEMKEWPPDKEEKPLVGPFETGMGGSTAAGSLGGLSAVREELARQEEKMKKEAADAKDGDQPEESQ